MFWLPIGDRVVNVEVPVCVNANTKPHRWVVVDRGTHWTLTPSLWPVDHQDIARGHAFHTDLPVGSIELTHAPPDVHGELQRLAFP